MQTNLFNKTSLTKSELLSTIERIISTNENNGWPEKTHAILKLLGIENFPIEVLRTLKIRGEVVPRSKEYPFTPKVKYLTFLWECFDTLPLSDDEEFAVPFRRLLASHIFKHCGNNLVAKKGVYLNFPHLLSVGDNVYLDRVSLDSKGTLTIGNNVSIVGPDTFIITHEHGETNHIIRYYSPVIIGDGAQLRPRVVVFVNHLDGSSDKYYIPIKTEILAGTTVLENSLVNKTICGTASGIPARVVNNPNNIKQLTLPHPMEEVLITTSSVVSRKEQQKCSSSSSSEDSKDKDAVEKLLSSIASCISTLHNDASNDECSQKISHVLQLLGAQQYSLDYLRQIVLPEESYPECKQYPFTNKQRYLTWLWRTFEKLPLHTAMTFAVAVRRILAEQLLKKCGEDITILHGVDFICPQRIEVGSDCLITEHVLINARGGFVMGNNVGLGEMMRIETCPASKLAHPDEPSIKIGDHARIGTAVTIHDKEGKGIVIGKCSGVGAKALVIANVPECTLVFGVPAKEIRKIQLPVGAIHSEWYNKDTSSSVSSSSSSCSSSSSSNYSIKNSSVSAVLNSGTTSALSTVGSLSSSTSSATLSACPVDKSPGTSLSTCSLSTSSSSSFFSSPQTTQQLAVDITKTSVTTHKNN